MCFSSQKREFDRFFNRLDRPVEESRPNRQPDRCRSTRPVSISGIGTMPIPDANYASGTSASTHSSALRLYQLWTKLTGTGNVRAICNYANQYRYYASFSPLCQLPTYRTRTIPKKAYRTSVPYFLAKIEAYLTVFTYRTVNLAFNYSQL